MTQPLTTDILSAALENLTARRHQIDEQIAEVRWLLGGGHRVQADWPETSHQRGWQACDRCCSTAPLGRTEGCGWNAHYEGQEAEAQAVCRGTGGYRGGAQEAVGSKAGGGSEGRGKSDASKGGLRAAGASGE